MTKQKAKASVKKGRFSRRNLSLQMLLYIHDVTASMLAKKMNCSRGFISELIRGKRQSRAIENRICKLFNISHEQLFKANNRGPRQ